MAGSLLITRIGELVTNSPADASESAGPGDFALINDETGQTFDFAREVSYYHDSDGTEGSRNNSVVIPSVPGGRYYLRIEPEMGPTAPSTRYEIFVRRDVPIYNYFWIAALLLLIPPALTTYRSLAFESRRWHESDYAPAVSSGGGDD